MAVPDPNKKPKAALGTPPLPPSTTPPVVKSAASVPNPHQEWINKQESGQGGIDNYTKTQNQRWQQANASGDTDLMNRLQADSQRVGYNLDAYKPNTAAPTQYGDWQAKQNELMGKMESMMNASFNYDPNTDPRYQAYQQLAKNRAGVASQAAMETMNDRGILNSSVTASQLGQIQQGAEQEALAAIPQFYAEARGDYQDKLRNAAELLSFASGRRDAAKSQMDSDRNYNRGVMESDRSFDRQVGRDQVADNQWQETMEYQKLSDQQKQEYQVARDAITDQRYQQEFDENARRWGLEYATNKAIQEGQLRISQQNANTSSASAANSAGNAEHNRLMSIWEATGSAPAGIAGVAPGTPFASKQNQPKPSEGEFKLNDYKGYINQNFMKPDPNGYEGEIFDAQGARRYIIGLGLADERTDELLSFYGLPTN